VNCGADMRDRIAVERSLDELWHSRVARRDR
jgi:hypothetical protein